MSDNHDHFLGEPLPEEELTAEEMAEICQSLEQMVSGNSPSSEMMPKPSQSRIVQHWKNAPLKVKLAICGCLVALTIPIGLVGRGKTLHQAVEVFQVERNAAGNVVVDRISGRTWTVRTPDQPEIETQMVGIEPISAIDVEQVNGILSMLVQHSNRRVTLVYPESAPQALVYLPNGTLLQRVLILEGLAKINAQELSILPKDIAQTLQKAQQSAQQQHKNLWSRS